MHRPIDLRIYRSESTSFKLQRGGFVEEELKICVALTIEYQREFPENVDTILKMKNGCAHRRALALLADEEHEQRELVLAFKKMERPGLFSPRIYP